MTDTIAVGDRVSFIDGDDQRVYGHVLRVDRQFYIVSGGWGGVKAVHARDLTKECG